jgi:hypothetical protein
MFIVARRTSAARAETTTRRQVPDVPKPDELAHLSPAAREAARKIVEKLPRIARKIRR